MAKQVRRLYGSFRPDNYVLVLELDPKNMKFIGTAVITGLKVGRPSKRITLHQKDLNIKSVKVTHFDSKGSKEYIPSRINLQNGFNEVRLHFDGLIPGGKYEIKVNYEGKINAQLQGIYTSTYKEAGKTKTIICTQFESHHAREAFPCIDEPEAKSVFNLTLKLPKDNKTVISNTEPLKEHITEDNFRVVSFEPTPKMSTYLLAFIAGDLKYLEAKTNNNVRIRTYSTKDNIGYLSFALECAAKTLDFYDEYFAIPYPLTKCDLIALPDFASGAMENWGCITFREQALLVDPKNTSLDLKQYVANVVAHELTHQWFGNLVTMRWWDDLWLNESFASWMSYLAVDFMFPEWQVWTQFINDEQAVGLRQDSLEFTHPIEMKISNPDEIRTVFDSISYDKGASVITMLHDYVGSDKFRDGIRLYLSAHTYGSTDTSDLWLALEEASGRPVGTFMSRWTAKSGYPLVKVSYVDSIHLEQQRFYLNPLASKELTIWPVPLFSDINIGNDTFNHRSVNLNQTDLPANPLINRGRRGFYRAIYDNQLLSSLIAEDTLSSLDDVDRLGLISDAFEASKGGYLPTVSALNIVESFFNETSVVVWEAIASGLGSIRIAMDDDLVRNGMKPFIRALISKEVKRLGITAKKSDSHFDKLLRPLIVGLAARADEPAVLKEIKELFYSKLPSDIDPDIRGVVYVTIARLGGKSDFETLVKMHNESNSPEEKLKLSAAITNFKQPELIKRALSMIRSDDVRSQDIVYWISYALSNHYGRDTAWQWLKENWKFIEESMGEDLSFYRMPFYVAVNYSSMEFLKEYKAFFEKHMSDAFERPLKQGIETIVWQAAWKKRDLDDIKNFFIKWAKT